MNQMRVRREVVNSLEQNLPIIASSHVVKTCVVSARILSPLDRHAPDRHLRDRSDDLEQLQHVEEDIHLTLPDGIVVNGRIDLINHTDRDETALVDNTLLQPTLDTIPLASQQLRTNTLPRLQHWCPTWNAWDYATICRSGPDIASAPGRRSIRSCPR